MGRILTVSLLVCVAGCTAAQAPRSSGPPSDVVAFVTQHLDAEARQTFRVGAEKVNIVASAPAPLVGADSLNGVTEKWCVRADFIFKRPGESQWRDARRIMLVIRGKNGLVVEGGFIPCTDRLPPNRN